ncbi:MAG: hypothetical protein Ct9H300mP24_2770 [Candidatus Neomarinimicrobiota bacterium]|nr:MAG: hypothetical protein CM1200mP31_3600 [Candidatus Neomarinimicrobiota bacterium]GIT65899.1 MAG: hypothetical protein Ct9H300mP24_2770 [Candidatus Neomarinimicrobiota bacterium]
MMSFDHVEILWCLIFILVPIYLLKNNLISKSYFYIQFISIILLCLFLAKPHINQSSESFDESSFLYDLNFNDYDIMNADSLAYQLKIDIKNPEVDNINMLISNGSTIYETLNIINIDSTQIINGSLPLNNSDSLFQISFLHRSNVITSLYHSIPEKKNIKIGSFFPNQSILENHSFLFNKDFITNENFIYDEFQKYNFQDKEIIILNDIDNLSNQSVVDLQKFLLNNGFIIVFLSSSFGNNKDLIYSLDYPDIKAVRGSSRNQFFTIENINFVNKDFLGIDEIFTKSKIYRYVQLENDENLFSKISFSTDDPLLLEKEVLNGKIFFITTKINSDWSNADFKSVLSDILDRILFQKMISNAF